MNLQPTLSNNLIKIVPLKSTDFDQLYAVAADPLIWEQHPNKDRYKPEAFQNFFNGAIQSKGAFMVYDQATGHVVGSSRFYEFDAANRSVAIGYTFIGRNYWGKGYNQALKTLMFNHAFQFVDKIILHIGETNFRSQKAIEKMGAHQIGKLDIAYYGEPIKTNFVYQINKTQWTKK